jgi:hypothetical protein
MAIFHHRREEPICFSSHFYSTEACMSSIRPDSTLSTFRSGELGVVRWVQATQGCDFCTYG